ncbi:MAG: hypothetical protein HRU31_16260 [Rhodobacteraceae bacterium]|nr:hypothetical protein [Paracoccaceae bacterium]
MFATTKAAFALARASSSALAKSANLGPWLTLLNTAAEALGLDPAHVTMHPVHLSGGVGRRGNMDFANIAARMQPQAMCKKSLM